MFLLCVCTDSPSQCVDPNKKRFEEGSYYYQVRPITVGPASQAAADIVFVVDESGSMADEHEWIREEVKILDRMLRDKGVGAGMRQNLFALVGFSRNNPLEILGVTLSQLATPSDFINASRRLMLTGGAEDGYAAIDYALENILTRPNTAKQLILVTDEDRFTLRLDLTRDRVEMALREAGFVLNVAVRQAFPLTMFDNTSYALGVTNSSAFVFDTFSNRMYLERSAQGVTPSQDITFGNTFDDYVTLAWNLGGGAWDLNQLQVGMFSRAFTNAFTDSKVQEVLSVYNYCFECKCYSTGEVCSLSDNILISDCNGEYPGSYIPTHDTIHCIRYKA